MKIHFGTKLFTFFLRPVQRLPLGFHYAMARFMAWVARDVLHYRRDEVVSNLTRAFPEMKYQEISETADKFYDHLCEVFVEAVWFGGRKGRPEEFRRSGLVDFHDYGELSEAISKGNVMLMHSHFGNWELISSIHLQAPPEFGQWVDPDHLTIVYKHLSSDFWDEFMYQNRVSLLPEGYDGLRESDNVMRYALKHRDEKTLFIFPVDQYPYADVGMVEVPDFLHQKTKFMTGAAALSRKLKAAVYYYSYNRVRRGRYDVRAYKICDDASQMPVEEIIQKYSELLAADIKANPVNYLWSHRRWK